MQTYNPPNLSDFQKRSLIVGVLFFVALLITAFFDRRQFFQAYLVGWTFWTGIGVGSLALLMLQHLTGGGWGFVIRRVLEAATRTLAVMAILFVPVIIGAHYIYHHWTEPEHPVVQFKTPYLNLPFFIIRAVVIFGVWLALAFFLNRWSLAQDRTADNRYTKKMRELSGGGMVALIFTVTFAAVDWYMSLEPEWFSTIYGLIWVAAWSLSALAFVIASMAFLSKQEPMSRVVAPLHFHDLGKLLLALVMLWSYFAFSQYLIIWSGNLPAEITWYTHRLQTGWRWVGTSLVLFHFAVPFVLLLSRAVKRDPEMLVKVAIAVLIVRLLDLFWLIAPEFHPAGIAVSWLDVVLPLTLGSIWLGCFVWQLRGRAILPVHDPEFDETLGRIIERGVSPREASPAEAQSPVAERRRAH